MLYDPGNDQESDRGHAAGARHQSCKFSEMISNQLTTGFSAEYADSEVREDLSQLQNP